MFVDILRVVIPEGWTRLLNLLVIVFLPSHSVYHCQAKAVQVRASLPVLRNAI